MSNPNVMAKNKRYQEGDRILTSIRSWDYGLSKVKKTPFVKVQFEGFITWTGYYTPKTKEDTRKTLTLLGFKGKKLGDLKNKDALDMSTEFAAVISDSSMYKEHWYHNARWINSVGGFTGSSSSSAADDYDIGGSSNQSNDGFEQNNNSINEVQNEEFNENDIPF